MDDRKLLELAAKAAGYGALLFCPTSRTDGFYSVEETDGGPLKRWNPLTDDGDALRLAVKLGIETEFYARTVYAGPRKTAKYAVDVTADRDMLSATRLAIVRAAAEIGRAM